MIAKWYAQAGDILGRRFVADAMKLALMKPTFVPNPDTQRVFADVAVQEIAGAGYVAGGVLLAGKSYSYDAGSDRVYIKADDPQWGPGATFDAAFAVLYDSTDVLWSYIDFQGTKSVNNGVLVVDFDALGVLYTVPL